MPTKKPTVRLNEASLNKVGMMLIDRNPVLLRCMNCHMTFSPLSHLDERRPKGWWKCPRGCNDQALKELAKRSR